MILSKEKCFICGETVEFTIPDEATLLREAKCSYCSASTRNSDCARSIVLALTGKEGSLKESIDILSSIKILNTASYGPIHENLKTIPGYTSFEYFDNIKPGNFKNDILCNDLQNLTFSKNSFDLIISEDVFEHIKNPKKAIQEIKRVLRFNGCHVFTVPLHEGRNTVNRNNLKPIYHGDPLRDGIIVTYDWGDDICKIIDRYGMHTERYDYHVYFDKCQITNADISYQDYLSKDPLMYFARKLRVHSVQV